MPTSSKETESDELLYSVTRYGPRTNCQRKGLIIHKLIERPRFDRQKKRNVLPVLEQGQSREYRPRLVTIGSVAAIPNVKACETVAERGPEWPCPSEIHQCARARRTRMR